MKKIYTILLLAVFAISANAQPFMLKKENGKKKMPQRNNMKGIYTYSLDSAWIYDLDSLDSPYVQYKYIFDFDDNGTETAFHLVTLNDSGSFENAYLGEYDYYNNGKTLVLSTYDYANNNISKDANDSILKDSKDSVMYNDNGNVVLHIYFEGNDSVWDNDGKEEYIYDADGKIILYKESYWSDSDSNWVYDGKNEYTYDNGLLSEQIYYNYDNSSDSWVSNEKDVYTYNSSNLIEEIHLNWNSSASQWDSSYKEVYSYNSDNLLEGYIYYSYDNESNAYIKDNKKGYTYDGDNNLITEVRYHWNGSSWENNRKYEYSYATSNLYTEEDQYNWDNSDGWILSDKELRTYADSIDVNTIKFSYIFTSDEGLMNDFFRGALVDYEYYEYEEDKASASLSEKYKFFYDKLNSSSLVANYKIDARIKLYPNPASDILFVSSEENIDGRIVVSDISGKTFRTINIYGTHTSIPVQTLPSGIYMISITDKNGNTLKTARIIKK